MKIDKKSVGIRLKRLRKEKNLTLDEEAKLLNVAGKTTVNAWEKGRAYPKKHIDKLAELYNTTIEYLNYGDLKNYIQKYIEQEFHSENTPIHNWLIEYFNKFYDYENYKNENRRVNVIERDAEGNSFIEVCSDANSELIQNFSIECLNKFILENLDKIHDEVQGETIFENNKAYDEKFLENHITFYIKKLVITRKQEFIFLSNDMKNKLSKMFADIGVISSLWKSPDDIKSGTVKERAELFYKAKLSDIIFGCEKNIEVLIEEYQKYIDNE